jgi:hypothetical protein
MEKNKPKTEKPADREKLYEVAAGLPAPQRKELGLRFNVPIYAQDPLVAKQHEKEGILGIEDIDVDWSPCLADGPTSARVAVVDYDNDTNLLAKPAVWDPEAQEFVGAQNRQSYAFHQVNVWAVVQNTLDFFEDPTVMGRRIPWGFDGNRIIVIPHAGVTQNAFYNRDGKCLQFYYFKSGQETVYTCLSHDIVAHETGHAVLDGIRPYYYRLSSVQTTAFHEFIADLTAILSALRINGIRRAIAKLSDEYHESKKDGMRGDIWNDDIICNLAEQFAAKEVEEKYGDSQRFYLRTAKNQTNMEDIANSLEPHDCSQVMTGAMFEILARITKMLSEKQTTKQALWNATQQVNSMAFRALDYCPPVDIQYSDYVQALLKVNAVAYPTDPNNYKEWLPEVFKSRGLTDFYAHFRRPYFNDLLWRYDLTTIASSRITAYHFLKDNSLILNIPENQDFLISDLYSTDKLVIELGGFRRLPREFIIEYVWEEDVELQGKQFGRLEGKVFPLLCGGTLVFDDRQNLLYWTKKPGTTGEVEYDLVDGNKRKQQLLDYIARLIATGRISQVEGEISGNAGFYQPTIRSSVVGNRLHLQINPQLMHPGYGHEGSL